MRKCLIFFSGFVLSFILFFQSSCQKKWLATITIKGKLVVDSSGAPLNTVLFLEAEDVTKPSLKQRVRLWEGVSGSEGVFEFRTQAARSPFYLLYIRRNAMDLNLNVETGVLHESSLEYFFVGDYFERDLGTIRVRL